MHMLHVATLCGMNCLRAVAAKALVLGAEDLSSIPGRIIQFIFKTVITASLLCGEWNTTDASVSGLIICSNTILYIVNHPGNAVI